MNDEKKKKLVLAVLTLFVVGLASTIAVQLNHYSSANSDSHVEDAEEAKAGEMAKQDEKYLYLLRKFKALGDESLTFSAVSEPRLVSLVKDPFVLPGQVANAIESPSTPLPTAAEAEVHSDLRIDGILWNENSPSAIIGGKIVRLGENILGYKVERIKKKEVLLTRSDDRVLLRLPDRLTR